MKLQGMRFWVLVWVGMAALLLVLISAWQLRLAQTQAAELHGAMLSEPIQIEPFELTAAGGGRYTLDDWRGNVVLVFFGFTNCPDVCPLTMGRLANIVRDLDEPEDLQVIMITVDPERDTPEVLQAYVEEFHQDFVGLSGDADEVRAAADSFFVGYEWFGQREHAQGEHGDHEHSAVEHVRGEHDHAAHDEDARDQVEHEHGEHDHAQHEQVEPDQATHRQDVHGQREDVQREEGLLHTDSVMVLDRQGRLRLIYGQQSMAHLEDDLRSILSRRDF